MKDRFGSTAVELLTSGHVRFDLTTIRKPPFRIRPEGAIAAKPERRTFRSAFEGGADR